MKKNDHIAQAKQCLAKGDDYYAQAAQHIIAAREEGWTVKALARELGRSERWLSYVVDWATKAEGPSGSPFSGEEQKKARYDRQAKTVLKDPERRRKVMAELPDKELDRIRGETTDELIGRAHAKQAEHNTTSHKPTVRDLMGDDPFDPSESWLDTHLIRVRSKTHILRKQFEKWGLVFGSLSEDEAFAYLQEAENDVAQVRAAMQERIADNRVEV